ncbi:MAG: FtsX-like permease family protein [Blastochloris sp.]|nr:FtsX-like permease family protein [Blastochloris sp.]
MRLLRIFLCHSWRYYRQHRVLAAVNILGISLGVTVFLAIQVVNQSALNAFRASIDLVAGKANLSIESEGTRFEEDVYPLVRLHPGIEAATPVLEEFAVLPDHPGLYLHILGVDPFSNFRFNVYEVRREEGNEGEDLSFFSDPDAIALTREMAELLGVKTGDTLRVQTSQGRLPLKVVALIEFKEDAPGRSRELAVMDLANVQDRFGLAGKLNRIDCLVREEIMRDPEARQKLQEELQGKLPGNVRVQEPGRRGAQVGKMTEAFQLNLSALSLIALVVGMFLMYNTMSASVVRRCTEIGLLRAMGLSRGEVQAMFLGEALLFGLIGISLGSVLGIVMAQGMVGTVSQTITSLYMLVRIQDLVVSPGSLALASGVGLLSVLAAAWFPSREATRVQPMEALAMGTLATRAQRGTGRWTGAGFILLLGSGLAGWYSLHWAGEARWVSFLAPLLALLGISFLVPGLSLWLSRRSLSGPLSLMLALRQFGRSMHRHSVTGAALVTAVSMVLGLSIMIHSFRVTVDSWIGRTIQADLYLAPASNLMIGAGERIPRRVIEQVSQTAGVEALNVYREIRLMLGDDVVKLAAANLKLVRQHHRFRLLEGTDKGIEIAVPDGTDLPVLVSEPFARQYGRGLDSRFQLATPQGMRGFVVRGIYEDFSTDRGLIFMDLERFREIWRDEEANSLALYLKPGVEPETVRDALTRDLEGEGNFFIYSNQKIRSEAMRIFDQTFAVTHLLRLIALVIAGCGIFLSISILTAERQREIGMMRAIGGSRSQVMSQLLWEAACLGAVAAVLGVLGGFVLAALLSYVINVTFFGWTIQWATPWVTVVLTPVLVVVAALASAWYPAWKAGRVGISNAVREE